MVGAGEGTAPPPPGGAPAYDVDLYGDDVLADPYPHYAALREAGPAVWLPRHRLWAIPRFEGVRHALRNAAVFSSAHRRRGQ